MSKPALRSVAVSLVIVLSALPGGLSAKERKGATVVVTRLDGSQARGELVAVKPDALLLSIEGTDLSVPLPEIDAVRIVRKSRAVLYGGVGAAAGLAGMGLLVAQGGGDGDYGTEYTLLGGGIGLIAGAIAGTITGIDRKFPVAGRPAAEVARYWARLASYARERRAGGAPPPAPAARPDVAPKALPMPSPAPATPAQAAPAPAPASRSGRVRIGLGASFPVGSQGYRLSSGMGSFRFQETVPFGEEGPYPVAFSHSQVKQLRNVYFGPLSASLDLTDRMAAEIELLVSGTADGASTIGEMSFTSAEDGREYGATAGAAYRANFTSVLAGLVFRTKAPTVLDRHIFELGLAAGPAFAGLDVRPWASTVAPAPYRLTRLTWSARAQGAYDFYIVPAFSVGAVAGYRHLRLDFAVRDYAAQFDFWTEDGPVPLTRQAEVSLPGRPIVWSGLFLGFRCGLRI